MARRTVTVEIARSAAPAAWWPRVTSTVTVLPEIVVPIEGGGLQILNNKGEIITTTALGIWPSGTDWKYPAPAIANLDFQVSPRSWSATV